MAAIDIAEVKKLIATEVRQAVADSRKGFPLWAKESLGFAIIMAGAGFIISQYIPARIGSQTSSMASDVAVLKNSVGMIEKDIGDIKKDIKDIKDTLNRALDRASHVLPADKQSNTEKKKAALRLVNEAIQIANDIRAKLDPVVLVAFGQSAISAARLPELRELAWKGAGLSVAQRSFINSDFKPPLPQIDETNNYEANFSAPGPIPGQMRWRGSWNTNGQGAAIRPLGSPDPNAARPAMPQYHLIEHAVADIDKTFIRSVVFRDSHIIYNGAPMVIDFLNPCWPLYPRHSRR